MFPSTSIYPQFLPALRIRLSSISLRIPLPHQSSLFQLLLHTNTHCHPNLIPPFCCPPLPTRHAHLCLLYVLWQQDNLFLPGHTRIAVTVENGCFPPRNGSVSVCEVTYSDKALGWGGVAANTPWQWARRTGWGQSGGAGLSKGPGSFNKTSVIRC